MSDVRWALLRPDEDGNPVKWLSSESELRELLADPEAWGIREFVHIDDKPTRDPAYWNTGDAMLMRVEVVVPVLGGYRLPEDGPATAANTAWRHGDLVHGSFGDKALGQPITLDQVHDSSRQVG